MLLSILYNKFFNNKQKTENNKQQNNEQQNNIPELRASISIGIDKNQQYFFDIKWDYEDFDKSANDLANIIVGIKYNLFMSHIRNLIINYDVSTKPYDEIILTKSIDLIEERSAILENLISNSEDPIVNPSNVFRSNVDDRRN
jgi:hypothetical protein